MEGILAGQAIPPPTPPTTPLPAGEGTVELTFSVREAVLWVGSIITGMIAAFGIIARWAVGYANSREEKYEKRLDAAITKFTAAQDASDRRWSERLAASEARDMETVEKLVTVMERVTHTVDQNTRVTDGVKTALDHANNRLQALEMRVQQLPPPGRRQGGSGGA